MKLRFWRREKKFDINKAIIGVDYVADPPTIIYGDDPIFTKDKNTLASNKMESMDLVHKDLINEPIIASDDDIFAKENQCQGTSTKSGKRCNRTAPLGRCWQHPLIKGDE